MHVSARSKEEIEPRKSRFSRVIEPVGGHPVPDAVAADVTKPRRPALRRVNDRTPGAIQVRICDGKIHRVGGDHASDWDLHLFDAVVDRAPARGARLATRGCNWILSKPRVGTHAHACDVKKFMAQSGSAGTEDAIVPVRDVDREVCDAPGRR